MDLDNDKHVVYSFFRQHPLVTLVSVNNQGVPQTAAVYVYVDEHMNFYFATRGTTRKYANIQDNPTVTLSAYDENVLMFGEVRGEAVVIDVSEDSSEVTSELIKIIESRKSSFWVPPVSQLEGEGYVYFKVTPKEVTFVNYEQSSSEHPLPHTVNFELN